MPIVDPCPRGFLLFLFQHEGEGGGGAIPPGPPPPLSPSLLQVS